MTRKYVLHPTFAVRMYPFYGHFNAYNGCIALFSFISPKINLHWIPHTSRHIKTTPSSSFYIGYCQQYSDYKTFGDLWRPFWIFLQKHGRKYWNSFFQFFRVNINETTQLFKICMKKSLQVSLICVMVASLLLTTLKDNCCSHLLHTCLTLDTIDNHYNGCVFHVVLTYARFGCVW